MSANRHVVSDILALPDQVMMIDRRVLAHRVADDRHNLLPALATLPQRTGCMIHHVFGEEFVNHRIVEGRSPSEQFFNDVLRRSLSHSHRLPDLACSCERRMADLSPVTVSFGDLLEATDATDRLR